MILAENRKRYKAKQRESCTWFRAKLTLLKDDVKLRKAYRGRVKSSPENAGTGVFGI